MTSIANGRSGTLLEPGTLWARITATTRLALECGAQEPIPTDWELVEQDQVRFLVRVLSRLVQKAETGKMREQAHGKAFDPFLPYDERLFVADISPTHVCLLNKFNVIDHHILIVTRHFEDQDSLLRLADFEAGWACMGELDGLAFYNGGKLAGASQAHKHLQIVPLPLALHGPRIPVEPVLESAQASGRLGEVPAFRFAHAFTRFDAGAPVSSEAAAHRALAWYRAMLQALGLASEGDDHAAPYNLLFTREWMLLVPRVQEAYGPISINSLGFAGSLFVRSPAELDLVKQYGPMTILERVARQRDARR